MLHAMVGGNIMNKQKLYSFGTFHVWIIVLKVFAVMLLPLSIVAYNIPADKGVVVGGGDGGSLLLNSYPYQQFTDTDDLLHVQSDSGGALTAMPFWQSFATKDKHEEQQQQEKGQQKGQQQGQHYISIYPLDSGGRFSLAMPRAEQNGGSDIWQMVDDGAALGRRQEGYHPVTSNEIDFETLNDFDKSLIRNAIWLPAPPALSPKYLNEMSNKLQQHQQPRIALRPLPVVPESSANIRYEKVMNPMLFMNKQRDAQSATSFLAQLRKDEESDNDDVENDNDANDDDAVAAAAVRRVNANDLGLLVNRKNVMTPHNNEGYAANGNGDDVDVDVNDASEIKDNEFPLKYNGVTSNKQSQNNQTSQKRLEDNGNGNLRNLLNKKIERNNYASDQNQNKELEYNDIHDRKRSKDKWRDKKKPKTLASTPFLPAVSGGAMTNLGKFFRDLSKNVQFSEKHEWTSEEQKLLQGEPTLGNLHHHLTEPHLKNDQAGEWIKAIRFYRPSQKIRSLVAMNPHGQWAHGGQFLDPNYMWVGLG